MEIERELLTTICYSTLILGGMAGILYGFMRMFRPMDDQIAFYEGVLRDIEKERAISQIVVNPNSDEAARVRGAKDITPRPPPSLPPGK